MLMKVYKIAMKNLNCEVEKMNIEEIKMDHFENFEELIKTCKMWIRDDDIDAYYRFFEFNCMKALVTAYEKEKEKNKELEKQYKILEVEKVRYNIQYLESSISQIPDTVMVYHSIKRDIETLKEQKIKLEKELQELLEEE